MNKRIKELAEQAGYNSKARIDREFDIFDIELFAELIRADERESIIRIIKHLSPTIIGKANDQETHQQWCDSAAEFSRFESLIAAIRARTT